MNWRLTGKYKILSVFTTFIFWILPPTGLSGNEPTAGDELNNPISPSVRASGNAAVYYKKAFDLLKYPDSKKLDKEINEIIKDGWRYEYKAVLDLLRQNELSLHAFQKGTDQVHCDFEFDRQEKYLCKKKFPAVEAWKLCTIVLLMGRYHEKQNEFEKAVNLYLASLLFARNIARDNLPISKATAFIIEHWTLLPIEDYLNRKEIEAQLCRKIAAHLEDYVDTRFAAAAILRALRDEMKSLLKMIADFFLKGVAKNARHHPDVISKAAVFRDEFISRSYKDINYYFGNFIRATETNEEKSWEFAIAEAEKFNKTAAAYLEGDSEETLGECFFSNMDDAYPACAEQIRVVLSSVMPIPREMINRYNESSKKLDELRSLAVTRCQ